jgi:hypothetical protein
VLAVAANVSAATIQVTTAEEGLTLEWKSAKKRRTS